MYVYSEIGLVKVLRQHISTFGEADGKFSLWKPKHFIHILDILSESVLRQSICKINTDTHC